MATKSIESGKYVKLEGRFWGNPDPESTFQAHHKIPVITRWITPQLSDTENGQTLRWKGLPNLTWWAEFDFIKADPKRSTFKGLNVPVDCSLSSYDDSEKVVQFRYDSKSDLEFWAQITIY